MRRQRRIGLALALTWAGCTSEGSVAVRDGSGGTLVAQPGSSSSARARPEPSAPAPVARNRVCTMLPCSDHAVVTAELSAASAGPGTHSFDLDVDGVQKRCVVTLTAGSRSDATCTAGVSLLMGPKMEQKVLELGGMVGVTEVPVPGRVTWQLSIYGRAKRVRVVHTSGAATIVDRTETLTYADTRPNGPDCDPVCAIATATWKVS